MGSVIKGTLPQQEPHAKQTRAKAAKRPAALSALESTEPTSLPQKLFKAYKGTIAILVFLAFWEILPRVGLVSNVYLPPFSTVIVHLVNGLVTGQLQVHIFTSLERIAVGLAVSEMIAIPLGLLIGWFAKAEEYLDPLLQLFRNISVLALFPVFILFLGIGETSKIAIIIWATVWATLINTIAGVKNIDPLLIKSAKSMGISKLHLFTWVVFPAALPSILTGFRLSATTSILVVVAAEMLGASSGLGYLIFYAEQAYDIPQMYVGIVLITILGFVSNFLIVRLERVLTKWKPTIGE